MCLYFRILTNIVLPQSNHEDSFKEFSEKLSKFMSNSAMDEMKRSKPGQRTNAVNSRGIHQQDMLQTENTGLDDNETHQQDTAIGLVFKKTAVYDQAASFYEKW